MSEHKDTYFGVAWDKENFEKPWRDYHFLRSIYESDLEPTQEEIAEELRVSASTVSKYMPDDAQRGGPGLPYEDVAMFSGGYDSLVATHYTMEKLDADCVLHINTKTGLKQNQDFVESVCGTFGWDLEIVTPNKTLTEFSKEWGFPKAPAHSWIYRYLKEHPLSSFVTRLEADKPRMYTGVRKSESSRRMENVSAETQEMWNGRWLWEAPIADFTEKDVEDYIIKNGLPRSPVVETIGRSGECFCGAYADRFDELLTLQENYPDHYEWIMNVEEEVQSEIGNDEDHCYWGSSGLSSDDLQKVMNDSSNSSDMTLCIDCEGGGHRSLGYEEEPTYETVYLAAPPLDCSDPFAWHKEVKGYDNIANWINPFKLNDYDDEETAKENSKQVFEKDTNMIESEVDSILVHHIAEYNLCGASIEAALANVNNVPIVVHNDSSDSVSLMLDEIADEIHTELQDAISASLKLGRMNVKKETGDNVFVK